MKMLHPDGKTVCDVNPADAEDEATLKANGWKPVEEAPKEPKAPKAPKEPKAKPE